MNYKDIKTLEDNIAKRHGIDQINAYTTYWPTENPPTVQVDGELTLQELRCLVEVMEDIHIRLGEQERAKGFYQSQIE